MKPLYWIGSSRADLKQMPASAQDAFGFALYQAQIGLKHVRAKPLRGFGSAGVLDIVEDEIGNAYRAIYTVNFPEAVYVLHCFKKKSVKGIATPKPDLDLIRGRLGTAAHHWAATVAKRGGLEK